MQIPVEVSMPGTGDISAVYTGMATLEAENEAVIVAKVSGVVEEILVEEGDWVEKDQVLARLDDEQLYYRMKQVEANLNKLHSDLERNRELLGKNLISTEEFNQVRYDYESTKAAFDLAQLELNYSSIRSSISGIVSERHIKVGNMITVNTPTFRVTDFNPLQAVLHIPESHISRIMVDQPVKLTADAVPGQQFTGTVQRISPVVDPASGTFKVTVNIDDPEMELKPGMFGRADIIYDTHRNALLVPREAVLLEDEEAVIFVVRDTIALRQQVQLGYSNTTHVEILSGVNITDTVVTTGQSGLKDSSLVQVIEYYQ